LATAPECQFHSVNCYCPTVYQIHQHPPRSTKICLKYSQNRLENMQICYRRTARVSKNRLRVLSGPKELLGSWSGVSQNALALALQVCGRLPTWLELTSPIEKGADRSPRLRKCSYCFRLRSACGRDPGQAVRHQPATRRSAREPANEATRRSVQSCQSSGFQCLLRKDYRCLR